MQQKVRWKERRITDMNSLLQDFKSKELLTDVTIFVVLFPGLSADVIIKHYNNQLSEGRGNRHNEQLEEGIKFGNKLSNAHIAFHRHKMNAAQTLSSSMQFEFFVYVSPPAQEDGDFK